MTRSVLLALVLALLGCNGSGPSSRAPSSAPSPPTPVVYTLTPVAASVTSGTVWQFTGPLAVLVTKDGKPVDGVNVAFRAVYPNMGPWALGDSLTGEGMWQGFDTPGSGISAVGFTPAVIGQVPVEARVVPVNSSGPVTPASSNPVTFMVEGGAP